MTFREANIQDLPQLSEVRFSVKENVLSNPALVTEADYVQHLTQLGKGWVCEEGGRALGFAIVNLQGRSIWALFVHPEAEGRGIGRELQRLMLDWYFAQTQETVRLGTQPGSRAAGFYAKTGWREVGAYSNGEIKFEMCFGDWKTA